LKTITKHKTMHILIDKHIIDAVFNKQQKGLRHIDGHDFADGKNKMDNYIFWEQNPTKNTPFARMAREGYRIVWGIPKNNITGQWILVVENEETLNKLKQNIRL